MEPTRPQHAEPPVPPAVAASSRAPAAHAGMPRDRGFDRAGGIQCLGISGSLELYPSNVRGPARCLHLDGDCGVKGKRGR